jgi:hypothetical protein
LEVVPEHTMPWKPEQAPQAMVTNSMGNSGPALALSKPKKAGYWMSMPPSRMPMKDAKIMP